MFARRYFTLTTRFHGATLLAKLLDSHPRVVCLGDTYPSNRIRQMCGCGSDMRECSFWLRIRQKTGAARHDACETMLPMHPANFGERLDNWMFRHLPLRLLQRLVPSASYADFAKDYQDFLTAVYDEFAEREPLVFVDGVKSASRFKALLAAGQRIDGVIHIVRDPPDFVRSDMLVHGRAGLRETIRSARLWNQEHRFIERIQNATRYLRIDYGALCDDTDATLRQIFEFLGLDGMTVDQLRHMPSRTWHFVGNDSMHKFDWRIRAKRYPVGRFDKLLINAIARTGSAK